MTLPAQEEIDKLKMDLLDMVVTMRRHCETSWGLIEKLYYRDGERNRVKISSPASDSLEYKNCRLSMVDCEIELSIILSPAKAKKLAHAILQELG